MNIVHMRLLGKEYVTPNGLHRIYFNRLNELIGLRVITKKPNGRVHTAALRGKPISAMVHKALDCNGKKFYYDVINKRFNYTDVPLAAVPFLQSIFE